MLSLSQRDVLSAFLFNVAYWYNKAIRRTVSEEDYSSRGHVQEIDIGREG